MLLRHAIPLALIAAAAARQRTGAQAAPDSPSSFRTLVRFTDEPSGGLLVSPNGRFVLRSLSNELQVYNLATRRSASVARGIVIAMAWSPRSDRVAWTRAGENEGEEIVWTAAIDSSSGAVVGTPQRVSVGSGTVPSISPDGRWIAYGAPLDKPSKSERLVVVPVTGGPERTIAVVGGLDELRWGGDGRTLYMIAGPDGEDWTLQKAFLDGRKPVVVHRLEGLWVAGMTRDRGRIILVPSKGTVERGDSATIIDTLGRTMARVPLPVGADYSYDGVIGDTTLVWEHFTDRRVLALRPVAGGPARLLPLVGESNEFPFWSPDGRRIAFQVIEGTRNSLAVMNADGSNVQVYRQTDMRADPWGMKWSHDSRTILFTSKDWHRLMLLDVAAGTITTILNDPAVRIGAWQWATDGRSITAAILHAPGPTTLERIPLSGPRVRLTTVTSLPAFDRGFLIVDGARLFTRGDSGAFLVTLGGAARKLTSIPAGGRPFHHAMSSDASLIATPYPDSTKPRHAMLELITLATGARREIELPFWLLRPPMPAFTPDNRTLLIAGRKLSDSSGANIYAVPTDGSPPRVVANMGGNLSQNGFTIAPDGRTIVYTKQRDFSTSMLLVDLRPPKAATPTGRR